MKTLFTALVLAATLPACIIVVSDDGLDTWNGRALSSTPTRTEVRATADFHALELHGSGRVEVRVGEAQSVVVTAEEALLPFLKTEVRDGTLVLDRAPGAPSTRRTVQYTVTVPKLDAAALLGSGDVRVSNAQGPSFRAAISGSGNLSASGSADELVVELDGSGDAHLSQLAAKNAKVRLAGSGDVHVAPIEALDVQLTGSGDVHYRGSPRVVQSVHGSGDVRRDAH
ncbi:MAG: DUF2807 domain-containing protein [Planctomycetes bacterium]|nr:DUF2807 domain-containing protein [Planctomycetota bacterium]